MLAHFLGPHSHENLGTDNQKEAAHLPLGWLGGISEGLQARWKS